MKMKGLMNISTSGTLKDTAEKTMYCLHYTEFKFLHVFT